MSAMRRITEMDVLSLENKTKLLQELKEEKLIELFKNKASRSSFKPAEAKKASLDQQCALTISREEKGILKNELLAIQSAGPKTSISNYIRNKSLSIPDINKWNEIALRGLKALSSDDYDESKLKKERAEYIRQIDKLSDVSTDNDLGTSEESLQLLDRKLKEVEMKIARTKKSKPKRQFRVAGRVTFNEANAIRWRAARLSLSVADYIRFLVFDYEPFSEFDTHLSLDARKRFYVSIMDVCKNGWGNPPTVNECSNCARHLHDIEVLREQLERYKALEQARRG
jgi:hypothetical protein